MLNKKVAIYIPSTTNHNVTASAEQIGKWTQSAKILLANLFGGFTATTGQGGYVSQKHGLIEESVTIVASFTDENGLTKMPEIRALARQIANDMKQEAVSVEFAGTLELISA